MNRASTPFEQDELEKVWVKFADSISKEMPRLYQVLKSNLPKLKDNYIMHLQVDNELQKKDIEDRVYSKITGWLKNELNNYQIQLIVNVASTQQKKKMVYTATDKFNYLAEQNENLLLLKKNFGLDFE